MRLLDDDGLTACVFLPSTAPPPNQTFAWNHGGIQPEVARTWVGIIGPGVEEPRPGPSFWSDHTDLRPTMLALTGLHDSYVSDGRVMTEVVDPKAVAQALKDNQGTLEALGQAWKQVNAPFGDFAKDTLIASTAALASESAGDATYTSLENQILSLGAARDQLADQIRLALHNAEFNGQKIKDKTARAWTDQANALLAAAHALRRRQASPATENGGAATHRRVTRPVAVVLPDAATGAIVGRGPVRSGVVRCGSPRLRPCSDSEPGAASGAANQWRRPDASADRQPSRARAISNPRQPRSQRCSPR